MASATPSRVNVPGLAVIAGLLLAWELAVRTGLIAYDFVPAPSAVLRGFMELARDGVLWPDIVHTLVSVAIGWAVAMIVGIALGLWLGFSPFARRFFAASLEILRPLPGIAFAPVALLLFGFSRQTELAIIILPVIWPVMVNTMGGIANVQPRLVDVGRTLRLSRFAIVCRLLLPAALPSIVVGARISLALALVMAIVAEIVGNPEGLGYAIVREQQSLHPDYMFANIAIVGVLGMLLNTGVFWLTRSLWPALAPRVV